MEGTQRQEKMLLFGLFFVYFFFSQKKGREILGPSPYIISRQKKFYSVQNL